MKYLRNTIRNRFYNNRIKYVLLYYNILLYTQCSPTRLYSSQTPLRNIFTTPRYSASAVEIRGWNVVLEYKYFCAQHLCGGYTVPAYSHSHRRAHTHSDANYNIIYVFILYITMGVIYNVYNRVGVFFSYNMYIQRFIEGM